MARQKTDDGLIPAFAYTRVSRMMENKMSTQSQIAEIERFCEFNGYKLIKVYSDEDLSGSETTQRVQFNQMFEDITHQTYGEIKMVVSYNISRFSRSVADLNKYTKILKEELNCDFRSIQESFINTSSSMGKFLLNVFGAIAELDRDRLIEVISDSNRNRAIHGGRWTNGGIPPYGYVRQDKTIVLDPETSELVKRVYHMFLVEKIPISTIAKHLNREEVSPARPDQDVSIYRTDKRLNELNIPTAWNSSKVSRILTNPVYTGINVTNRRKRSKSERGNKTSHVNADTHTWVFSDKLRILRVDEENFWNSDFEVLGFDFEPIIEFETFVEAQKLKAQNQKCVAVREKTNYLLKDLLYCGECGRRMNGQIHHRDPKNTYYYYRCNKRQYLDGCTMESVWCSVVDNYVMAALSDSFILIMINDLLELENSKVSEELEKYNKEIALIEKDIEKCNNSILNIIEMIKSSSTIDLVKESLAEEINREQSRKIRLENELTRVKLRADTESRTKADVDGFVDAWRNADFSKMSFEMKREFFVKYIDRVVYYSPDHIDIYVKINRTTRKLDFTEDQLEKIKLKVGKQPNMPKRKIYNVVNKFLEKLGNLDTERFSWMWHFVNEPLSLRKLW